jgi:nucleoid-associated protein YgaU
MSLPINAKFEVPKHKAPSPTKTSLWPALTPVQAPAGGRRGDAGRAVRPITPFDGSAGAGPADRRPRRGRPLGRSTLMKLAIPVVPMVLVAAVLGLGCANEKVTAKPAGAMDVGAKPVGTPPPAANSIVAAPVAAAPVRPAKPASANEPAATKAAPSAAAPAEATGSAAAATPQTYVVQKGDTLTKIARTQYGDGNKWKRIAEANPGVTPSTIKVGQKLVIPAL